MSEKVVVTGGAGFIGHVFIKHLIENTEFEIISIDRLDYSGNLNRISDRCKIMMMKLRKGKNYSSRSKSRNKQLSSISNRRCKTYFSHSCFFTC